MKLFPTLTDVTGVPAAGQSNKVTLKLPAGGDPGAGRLLNLRLIVKRGAAAATLAQMRAGLKELRFILGTEVVQRLNVSEILATQDANGYTVEDGIVDLFFAEPWRALVTDEEVLAPDLRRYSSASLEIDVTNDATAFEFTFDAEFSDDPKVDSNKQPVTGMIGKDVQITDVQGGQPIFKLDPFKGPLQRLFIAYPSAATITKVELMQGDTTLYERRQDTARKGLTAQLKGMGMRIPSNYTDHLNTWKVWPLIPDNNQQLRNALMNPVGLKIRLEIDTAAGLRIVREQQISRG